MDGSMGINGRSMDMSRIDERVPLGSVEIWEIQNRMKEGKLKRKNIGRRGYHQAQVR